VINDENSNTCVLRWIGNAGWQIRFGPISILIDPDLETGSFKLPNAVISDTLADEIIHTTDAVLVSHEHGDHFNRPTAHRLAEESDCRFILPASCLYAAREAGLPQKRIIAAHHRRKIDLFGDGLTVTPFPAIHGHIHGSVYRHYDPSDCGYLIQTESLGLFHPGDTLLLDEHFDLPEVDVLFVSPTEHNTNVLQSLVLISKLMPRYILPQHRDTYVVTDDNYFWTSAHDKTLYDALDENQKERYHTLPIGGEIKIEP